MVDISDMVPFEDIAFMVLSSIFGVVLSKGDKACVSRHLFLVFEEFSDWESVTLLGLTYYIHPPIHSQGHTREHKLLYASVKLIVCSYGKDDKSNGLHQAKENQTSFDTLGNDTI